MKHIPLYTLLSTLYTLLSAHAAVPLPPWTVDTRSAQPATFEAYQGETLTFEAHLQANGKPLEAPLNYSFFWQTNGMGSTYWEVECGRGGECGIGGGSTSSTPSTSSTSSTNVLFATWLPEYDVGAKVYNCFIGSPSNNYHAAFQLRLSPSPGAIPNFLPLPTPVIDFAKVRVLNPPWGSGGGVDTNAVRDIVRETVSGDARPLPKYLHALDFADSYTNEAAWYYSQRGGAVPAAQCSAVRSGGFLYRNFDYPFDDRAEFVVRMAAGPDRFASVGVAQVGTNLTEQMVTSGKPSRWYKCLPGATVDGINENGVVAEINVVDGDPGWGGGVSPALHPLAAVRWALDHATNAQHAAAYLASHIAFPSGWTQNFHYMIADETSTYIIEDGTNYLVGAGASRPRAVMTNFRLYPTRDTTGAGQERYDLLAGGANITNAWYTLAYSRDTNPPWYSEFESFSYEDMNRMYFAWESSTRESHRGERFGSLTWWQTVHTSVYDITNRVLHISVQEIDDWYTFQVPVTGGGTDEAKVREIANATIAASPIIAAKADKSTTYTKDETLALWNDPGWTSSTKYWLTSTTGADLWNDPGWTSSTKYWLTSTTGADLWNDPGWTSSTKYWLTSTTGADLWNDPGWTSSTKYWLTSSSGVWSDLSWKSSADAWLGTKNLAPRSMISRNDTTFSNEVAAVAATVSPPPLPYLRVWDEVLQCWWIGRMVNGVMQWEVE